jgi:hypothetical protein
MLRASSRRYFWLAHTEVRSYGGIGMKRSTLRTSQWITFTILFSPAANCWAIEPTSLETEAPAVQEVATVEPAQEVSVAEVPLKDRPLFKHESYPAAWTASQESNRPILVYVTMPQCPHCTKMIDGTYGCKEVDELVKESFETLQASRYTHATLVSKLHVRWYPTTVLVGSNNKVLDMIEGYVDANTFKRRLQLGIASANSSATATQTR